jgi:hypothetical protein
MSEEKILQVALSLAFSDVETNESAVRNDDHIAVVGNVEGGSTVCVRVFWPDAFSRIRDKLHITTNEIQDELRNGPLVVSETAGEYDADCYFSARERLVVRCLSADECSDFREIFSELSAHMLSAEETLLPSTIAFFKVEPSIKIKMKSQFFVVTRSIFPRQMHEHIFFLDLKGCTTRAQEDGLFLKDADVTWEHEMSFGQEEREDIIRSMREDIQFLQRMNRTNYSLVVAITKRYVQTTMQLPGQPYGPDVEEGSDDRKKTLPIRHDIPDGAKAIRADLVPKPRFSDEHPEWYTCIILSLCYF